MNHRDPDEQSNDGSNELIEDLKSIKDLLGEAPIDADADAKTTADDQDEEDIPLLDDPLDERVTFDEGLADETFKTLMGDTWRDSVETLFNEARRNIEENSSQWLPEHTDELADALKIRIDASVRTWLAETLEANIGRLREYIVRELSDEILNHMRDKLSQPQPRKDTDSNHG